MIYPPCYKCEDRTVSPNCHNPEICSKWAAYRTEVEKENLKIKKLREKQYKYSYLEKDPRVSDKKPTMSMDGKYRVWSSR